MPNIFDHAPIDRTAHKRLDHEWLASHSHTPALYVRQGMVAIIPGAEPRLAWVPADLPGIRLFLGMQDNQPVFAILGDASAPPALPDVQLVNLRDVGMLLPPAEAHLAAYALGYDHWHARHRCCGVCGTSLQTVDAGHRKLCPNCQAEHFPRTDPAIIVLVTHGEYALLAHSHKYPPGRYSTLAGFVEPGESLEAAVRREMFEEAGVTLRRIDYHSSQPWPFPGSLMLGFYAEAESLEIAPDGIEILDARWLTRADLRRLQALPPAEFSLPSPLSISRRLIDAWLQQERY
jgi:NAD+ diphosphatase